MRVGILVPARNTKFFIEACLTTLQAQTHRVSVYVVDDASDDGLYDFLVGRKNLYTKLARNTSRKGWPKTLNKCADMAIADGCEALFVMASDDLLRLDCIKKCVRALDKKDWCVVYAQQIGAENVIQASKENAVLEDFLHHPPIVNYGLIPTKVWKEVGGYSTDITLPDNYGFKEDWDFWIKVFKAGYTNYDVVKEPVYYYIMHDNQLHKSGVHRYEEARKVILEKHGLQES
jgi:GT2 family glycosyltransferase